MTGFIVKISENADNNELITGFKVLQRLLCSFPVEALGKKGDSIQIFSYLWSIETRILESNDPNLCAFYVETISKLLLPYLERIKEIGDFEEVWLSYLERFAKIYQIAKQKKQLETLVLNEKVNLMIKFID